MTVRTTPDRDWFKSSRSANNAACVEVSVTGGTVGVRDSKHRGGPELVFGLGAWSGFVAAIKTPERR